MPNVSMKTLKLLAISIAIILGLILIFVLDKNRKPPVEEIVLYESINSSERVIHYGDELYCCTRINADGKIKNVLIRLPIDFDDSTTRTIVDTLNTDFMGKKELEVYDNKLFYSNGKTYFYDLTSKDIKEFCEGELQFMLNEDSFVMLQDGDLYKGTYYLETYLPRKFEKIAEGNFVKRGEDTEKIYYSSIAGSNTILVALDKKALNVVTMDNIDTTKRKMLDILVADDYIYEIVMDSKIKTVRKVSKKLNKNNEAVVQEYRLGEFDIFEFIDFKYTKKLNIGVKKDDYQSSNDFYFYGSIMLDPGNVDVAPTYETKMYKYEEITNSVSVYDGMLNERFAKDYSGDINGSNIELYHGNTKLTELETGIDDMASVKVVDINVVEGKDKYYLYYEIEVQKEDKTIETIFARTYLDGGDSIRINIPQN